MLRGIGKKNFIVLLERSLKIIYNNFLHFSHILSGSRDIFIVNNTLSAIHSFLKAHRLLQEKINTINC